MIDIEQGELVMLAIVGCANRSNSRDAVSMPELVAALGPQADRLGQQMILAKTLQSLREAGFIETTTDTDGSLLFSLTPEGTDRAGAVYDRIASTEIDIVTETTRTLSLEKAAATVDRSIPQLVAGLTDENRYYDRQAVDHRLVGRDRERDRCRQLLDNGMDGAGRQILAVTGPGGIGKTTFAKNVLADANELGYTAVYTRCQTSNDTPYSPIDDLLSKLQMSSPIVTGGSDIDDPETFQHRQAALFYEFTRALTPRPEDPPRLLCFDDLHLADSETVSYLDHLSERLDERRIVLLVSYRPAEFTRPEGAESMIPDAGEGVHTIQLSPLDRSATRKVIEQTTNHRGAPDPFVEAIHDRTGGNPLFVEEMVAALIETNELDPAYEWYPRSDTAIDVPESVLELIGSQVDALEDAARDVLEWAALVGDRVPMSVLTHVVDRPELQVTTLVEALIEGGIFDRTADGTVVTFRSDVIRDAVYPTDRDLRADHARIAEAFESIYRAEEDGSVGAHEWLGTIAGQYDRAGNPSEAFEWYCKAGRRAMDVYAHETALTHYHTALDLARQLDDDGAMLTVAERLGEIYLVTADFDRAARHVAFARERATDPSRRQRLAALKTRLANLVGEYETAAATAREGIAIDPSPSREYCELLLGRSEAENHVGAFDAAIETAETAREIADDIGAEELLVEATYQLGMYATKQDRLECARESLQKALTRAEELDMLGRVASIHLALGSAAFKRDDRDAMERHNHRALETFERIGDSHGAALARSNLAVLDRKRGDFDTAHDRLEQAIETLEALGDFHGAARQRGNLGSLSLSRGAYDAARTYYRKALAGFEEVGERREVAIARTGLGQVAIKLGDLETARSELERAHEEFVAMEIRRGAANATLHLAIVDLEEGEYETARSALTDALEYYESIGDRSHILTTQLTLACVDTATESPQDGLAWWPEIEPHLEMIDPSNSVEPFERIIRSCTDQHDTAAAIEWCENGLAQLDSDVAGLSRLRTVLYETRRELEEDRSG